MPRPRSSSVTVSSSSSTTMTNNGLESYMSSEEQHHAQSHPITPMTEEGGGHGAAAASSANNFLVGDVIDLWSLQRSFYWPQAHNAEGVDNDSSNSNSQSFSSIRIPSRLVGNQRNHFYSSSTVSSLKKPIPSMHITTGAVTGEDDNDVQIINLAAGGTSEVSDAQSSSSNSSSSASKAKPSPSSSLFIIEDDDDDDDDDDEDYHFGKSSIQNTKIQVLNHRSHTNTLDSFFAAEELQLMVSRQMSMSMDVPTPPAPVPSPTDAPVPPVRVP